MTDLHDRFRSLDRAPAPDLWSEVTLRATAPPAQQQRMFAMRNPMYAVAVIAVVAVAGLAALYAIGPGLNVGGPGPAESTTPSTPEPTPEPTPERTPTATCLPSVAWEPCPVSTQSPAPEGMLPEGPHALVDGEAGDEPPPMTVTIPAPDWYQASWDPGTLVKNNHISNRRGAGIVVFYRDLPVNEGPPCDRGVRPRLATLATTVDELVAALTSQTYRYSTGPVDVTVGGYAGKSITLRVPEDALLNACDDPTFAAWRTSEEYPYWRSPFHHEAPGHTDKLWILDVDGLLVVIDTAYSEQTPQKVVDEMEAIVGSITFGE